VLGTEGVTGEATNITTKQNGGAGLTAAAKAAATKAPLKAPPGIMVPPTGVPSA